MSTLQVTEKEQPIAYLAWRDGEPCWDEDCVCQDPVYPVDADDDRTSMPVYTRPSNLAAYVRQLEDENTPAFIALRKALGQAIETLREYIDYPDVENTIAAIRKTLNETQG